MYRDLISRASPFHRVVALDHLGMGLSDRPSPATFRYDLESHVENTVAFIDALDLTKATLVLHDWGGAIGMGVALARPERIGRIVVMNSAAFFVPRIPKRIAVCRAPGLGEFLVRGLNAFALAATRMTTVSPLQGTVRAGYVAPYNSWRRRIGIARFVQDIPMEARHPTRATLGAIERGLESISAPMLLLWGERDWCFTPEFRDKWRARFPHAYVHSFDDAGHLVIEDRTDVVIARIRDFHD
jgi:haloalkane dehalogenase